MQALPQLERWLNTNCCQPWHTGGIAPEQADVADVENLFVLICSV
jgi:hypothetical protein